MSSPEVPLHRSYLYAPGSDGRIVEKAVAAGADAVVLDLEDAVAPAAKAVARDVVADVLTATAPAGGPELHVRVNRSGDGYDVADLEAVVWPRLVAVRLPKVERPEAVREVEAVLDRLEAARGLERGHVRLYPTVESAVGAVRVPALVACSPRIVRFSLGASDLLADIAARGDDDIATIHVRSELVLHSRAAGIGPPIDSVHTDLDDERGLVAGARRARALGFRGKSVIHPRQLAVVHRVFEPTPEEVHNAETIVRAAEQALQDGRGAVALDGAFVDAATVARARALLRTRSDL